MIMERKGNKVKTSEGDEFDIPSDMSMLTFFGAPINSAKAVSGDSFNADGYVYGKNGTRKGKWFVGYTGKDGCCRPMRLWEPKKKQIVKLEALRWKILSHVKTRIEPRYNFYFESMQAVKIAHLHFTKSKKSAEGWRRFNASETGISFDWLKQKPSNPKNQYVARKYVYWQDRLDWFYHYAYMTKELLIAALQNSLLPAQRHGERIKVIINERLYYFHAICNKWNVLRWEPLSLPENDDKIVVLKD